MVIGNVGAALLHQRHGVRVFLYVLHATRKCVIVPLQTESAILTTAEVPTVIRRVLEVETSLTKGAASFSLLLRSRRNPDRLETWDIENPEGDITFKPGATATEVTNRVRTAIMAHQDRERVFPELEQSTTAA
ncbi:MAG: hypothetical protein H6760_02665 [Candidatus Nomurabacteria bacterium]|nr:MAG: hypothetical protein H6760_02665 [Candidatus Nomurabacteria bacterium]